MYSIYDGKRKADNTMSDQIEREQQIEEESLTKNSLQIQKAAWIREELEKRRAQEDQLLQQILREQQMLQELDEDMDVLEGRRGGVQPVQSLIGLFRNNIGDGGLSGTGGTVEHHIGVGALFDQAAQHCAGRQQMTLTHHLIQAFGADLIRQGTLHGGPSLPKYLTSYFIILLFELPCFFPGLLPKFMVSCGQEVMTVSSKAAIKRIIETLKGIYPNALCSLQYEKDYELLFAVRLSAQCTECRAECERVDDGSAHAHLVALHAVEAFRCAAESAEDVAAADYNTYLHAHFVHFLNLLCVFAQTYRVDTEALFAHEALAAELEENSLELCHVVCLVCFVFICYCWGVLCLVGAP